MSVKRPLPDIALIVTMDGSVTAVKADTGSKLWFVSSLRVYCIVAEQLGLDCEVSDYHSRILVAGLWIYKDRSSLRGRMRLYFR